MEGDHVALIAQLDGSRIDASAVPPDSWLRLKKSDDRKRLVMPVCGMKAVAKNRGSTQFFSHLRRPDCRVDHGGESAQHEAMKRALAVAIGRVPGWTAVIEHPHPSREWIIDVMARADDGRRIYAFEVQLSGQTPEQYAYRTQRYFDSRVMPVWLIPRDLPYGPIKIPTIVTGFSKSSPIPDAPEEILRQFSLPCDFELQAAPLGEILMKLLTQGHHWTHGGPRHQQAVLEAARVREEQERLEQEARVAAAQMAIDELAARTTPVGDVYGSHVIRTQPGLYVASALTRCHKPTCDLPMLIWVAWGPTGYWASRQKPDPSAASAVGKKRFDHHADVRRLIDRWICDVQCDTPKALIQVRPRSSGYGDYSVFLCPRCSTVCGQSYLAGLRSSKWSIIGSPKIDE